MRKGSGFQEYTRYISTIWFPNKILFSFIRIHILLQWVCAVYRTILLRDEESILQCYTMVHRTVGYNRNIPGICTVYARHIHQFGMIDLSEQRKRRNCHHESELVCTDHYQCWGHDIIHQNAFFIQHECLTGIYQVYTKYIHIISLMPPFCGPSWSPKRAWMSQTWTFYGSLPSWPLKVLQL